MRRASRAYFFFFFPSLLHSRFIWFLARGARRAHNRPCLFFFPPLSQCISRGPRHVARPIRPIYLTPTSYPTPLHFTADAPVVVACARSRPQALPRAREFIFSFLFSSSCFLYEPVSYTTLQNIYMYRNFLYSSCISCVTNFSFTCQFTHVYLNFGLYMMQAKINWYPLYFCSLQKKNCSFNVTKICSHCVGCPRRKSVYTTIFFLILDKLFYFFYFRLVKSIFAKSGIFFILLKLVDDDDGILRSTSTNCMKFLFQYPVHYVNTFIFRVVKKKQIYHKHSKINKILFFFEM